MAEIKFNYNSLRSMEARATIAITSLWRTVLQYCGWLLIVLGLAIVALSYHFGWLVMIPGIIMSATYQWWRWHLYHLATVEGNDNQVDNIMSSSVLGRLSKNPSPRELAEILAQTSSGIFLVTRFGLGPRFLFELASSDSADMSKIWSSALEIRQQTKSPTLSGGVLSLALIVNFPNYEAVLAKLQLSYDDLLKGVHWHDYVHAVKSRTRLLRTGGIARDWSFGYTPLLDRFGRNISQEIVMHQFLLTTTESHHQVVDSMIDTFSGNGRQNIALVGPDGAGKTTMVFSLAERLLDADADLPDHLQFRQIILLDATALIAEAPGRGELEKLVTQLFAEAHLARNIILCLDNANVFFEEATGSVDISNILLPILEAGNVRLIMTMNEHRMLKISQENPALGHAINKIVVNPASEEETQLAMQDRVLSFEKRFGVVYMYQALREAYRLGERYVHDLVMPGKAIKLMEISAPFAENGLVTVSSVQRAIEEKMNVKIGAVNHESEREMLLNLEERIHQRMINQSRAVSVVSNALRRARAGVASQKKPIGTFLFLGPTGVGKTELAKALAEVYFGTEDNLVRLDMNEFVTIEDVSRLIEDGSKNPHSLTAQIMQRPFSVILLDEIEKANPAVLSTLLQLLDEGVLRDENNRQVSFRDSLVIATSNAGADRIREYIERGYEVSKFEKQFIDELISSNQFRPEFLNRFDEILVFRPLTKPELKQVLDLIIKSVNKNLARQKITVEVADNAKDYLVEAGYDPRLGARPMRRVVQSTVENIVARAVIEGGDLSGSNFVISLEEVKNIIDTRKQADSLAISE